MMNIIKKIIAVSMICIWVVASIIILLRQFSITGGGPMFSRENIIGLVMWVIITAPVVYLIVNIMKSKD